MSLTAAGGPPGATEVQDTSLRKPGAVLPAYIAVRRDVCTRSKRLGTPEHGTGLGAAKCCPSTCRTRLFRCYGDGAGSSTVGSGTMNSRLLPSSVLLKQMCFRPKRDDRAARSHCCTTGTVSRCERACFHTCARASAGGRMRVPLARDALLARLLGRAPIWGHLASFRCATRTRRRPGSLVARRCSCSWRHWRFREKEGDREGERESPRLIVICESHQRPTGILPSIQRPKGRF